MELNECTNEELLKVAVEAKAIIAQRKQDVKDDEVQVALKMLEEVNLLGKPTYSMSAVAQYTGIGVTRIKNAQAKMQVTDEPV